MAGLTSPVFLTQCVLNAPEGTRGLFMEGPTSPATLCPLSTATHRPAAWSVSCTAHVTFSSLLSLQQEHVGVLGTSVHVFPDSLRKDRQT